MSLANQMKAIAEEARKKREDLGERRGILKPTATTSAKTSPLPRRSQSFAAPRTVFKKSAFADVIRPQPAKTDVASAKCRESSSVTEKSRDSVDKSRTDPNDTRSTPVAIEVSSADKDDEGISCNDSESDSEVSDVKNSNVKPSAFRRKHGGDDTSEGESSGGREVRSIFRNELNLSFRNKLEGALSKSASHTTFGNTLKTSNAVHSSTSADDFRKSKASTGLRRSHTHTEGSMPQKLADIKAALQQNGEKEWMNRVHLNNNFGEELKLLKEKNRYNDELSEKTLLAAKKDELDTAQKQWRHRVEKSDAETFSVAGKMGEKIKDAVPHINIPSVDNKTKTPRARRFKGKEADSSSTPSSPEKNSLFDLTRSRSAFSPFIQENTGLDKASKISSRTVAIVKPDDETFKSFFESVSEKSITENIDLNPEDFDKIERQSLLVTRKNVKAQRRRVATRNPIKALALRTDIAEEYTEVITGVAEREKKRLNIEKLAINSDKAVEALAGLMSNEDFKSVALKKGTGPTTLMPWKTSPMLLQIKGRRHVQTRLVEPVAESINEGDCYVLVTSRALYNYIGAYSNVIEQSRAADVANHIQKTGDMGCNISKVITISNKTSSQKHLEEFWKILGADKVPEVIGAGHPSEDETFESNILTTNMIYTLDENELVPYDQYWGRIPKIEMLKETSIVVFDFGSEMYIWSGKNANLGRKKLALKLAKEMWDEGYDYSDCNVCPLNVVSALGDRSHPELSRKSRKRPDWALFCKITQHRETILFTEKFLDWPHFSRVIRVRSDDGIRRSPSLEVKPCNVDEMLSDKGHLPDLVTNTTHLGRGDQFFDEETRRMFEYHTLEIVGWRISENTHKQLEEGSIGQFHGGDSYIYSWKFRQTVKGRELGGGASKHAQVGRDRYIFFCWQGEKSSVNEKCMAAFLTVEFDKVNAPQIRVVQGTEPAAFLRLFNSTMVIHQGDYVRSTLKARLFLVRGEVEEEVYLIEVPLSMASLRSRSSFVLVDVESEKAIVWHGCKSSPQKKKVAKEIISKLAIKKPPELFLDELENELEIEETEEGCECEEFLNLVGHDRDSYCSLLNSDKEFDFTSRLYKMTSVTGSFQATEVLCAHRSHYSSPYPFMQSELYSASQPVLFLLDNKYELWLWHGWWPQGEEEEEIELGNDQTGSGIVRWQAERKAAMQTAVNFWKKQHEDDEDSEVVAHLIWAGLEPLEFQNLFPVWEVREDVMELNMKDGKNPGDKIPLQTELARLLRSTYPLSDLMTRPLPEGVDPTQLEIYLSNDDFEDLLSMSREEFQRMPSWKKTALKKEKGLF